MAVVPAAGRADRAPAEAASVLFEQYRTRIHAYCLHQLSSREEAEDATQTTFMNAFRGLERGIVPESEQAWLFKIAENVCLSRRRSSWRRGRIESPSDFEQLEEIIPSPSRDLADELIGLQDALEAMPETQRRAILLREWQGLSYREIADELELSQAAVETLIFRARRTLATGLQEPEPAKKRRRRVLVGGLNLGSALSALKEVVLGGSAAKAVAVAVAATSTTVAATNLPDRSDVDPRRGATKPVGIEAQPQPAVPVPVVRNDPAPERTAPVAKASAEKTRAKKPQRVERASGRASAQPSAALEPVVEEAPAPVVADPVDRPLTTPAAEHQQPQGKQKPVEAKAPAAAVKDKEKGKPAEDTQPTRALQSGEPAPASEEKGKEDKPEQPAEPGPPADKLPEQSRAEGGPPEHAQDKGGEGKAGRDK